MTKKSKQKDSKARKGGNDEEIVESSAEENASDETYSDEEESEDGESSTDNSSVDDCSTDDCSTEDGSSENQDEDSELSSLKEESALNYDKYLRVAAELENIKKRNAKDRFELIKYAGEGLARDLLDIVDSLDLAINQENKGSIEEFEKGISLVLNQFKGILDKHSIKSVTLKDQSFDPEKAEALATAPAEKDKVGFVIEEFKKAYYFKDKLLRPAQVVVGKLFEEEPGEEPSLDVEDDEEPLTEENSDES